MEAKERFELFGKQYIKDNNPDAHPQLFDAYVTCVSLDEQDKRIKELEEKDKEVVEEMPEEIREGLKERLKKAHVDIISMKMSLADLNRYLKAIDEEIDDQIKELNGEVK